MARPRKPLHADSCWSKNGSSSSACSADKLPPPAPSALAALAAHWKTALGSLCLLVAAYFGYIGYLETRVNTPFDEHKVVQRSGPDVPERFWGSYRPGNYFGMRTREQHSLLMGLMWYSPQRLRPGGDGIRHWCSQSDDLSRYGWIRHDGVKFGEQEILDGPWLLRTTFIKGATGGSRGGDWTARIEVTARDPHHNGSTDLVSLLWYTSGEGVPGADLRPSQASRGATGVRGYTPSLGDFKLNILPIKGKVHHESYLSTVSLGSHLLKETVVSSLRLAQDQKTNQQWIALAGVLTDKSTEPNLIATQLTMSVPCTLDVVFESASTATWRDGELSGDAYSRQLAEHRKAFDQRFDDTFKLSDKGYNATAVKFARATLSNLVGGIGYFHGSSRVLSPYTREPVPYWKAPLYTAVPSRSHFPRGFLWDEGFHCLLIARWDREIALDIMAHWFDLMNVEGWIPREQILGAEAQARVPEEFVTQRNSNANPPTFFLLLLQLLGEHPKEMDPESDEFRLLNRMFPRLQAWYNWFNTTQAGELPTSYRWRGRRDDINTELNPKTLTSGLDDYPRASHPSSIERHVDLRCWMLLGARAMAALSLVLEKGPAHLRYSAAVRSLSDPELLAQLHWSEHTDSFADYGMHTDAVTLRREPAPQGARGGSALPGMTRATLRAPEPRAVDSALGYVSLFPLLVKALPPGDERLARVLATLDRKDKLWSPVGLRSLSQTSPMYMKRNTEHDPPYWRGQVWANINYLALAALHHYAAEPAATQPRALQLYAGLRVNVIDNIMRQYLKSGYVWEQYNDATGEGSGCRPFTGWSSLVVLMMAEQY